MLLCENRDYSNFLEWKFLHRLYGFNSPMFWSDPSGLVPVKNKVKNSERLQAFEQDWGRIKEDNEAWAAIASIIDQINPKLFFFYVI